MGRYLVRKIEMTELMNVLVQESDEDGIDKTTLQAGFTAILEVFKIKAAAEKKVKASVPPIQTVSNSEASATASTAPSPAAAVPVQTASNTAADAPTAGGILAAGAHSCVAGPVQD